MGATLAQFHVVEVRLHILEVFLVPVLRLDPGSIGIHIGEEHGVIEGGVAELVLFIHPSYPVGQHHGFVGTAARTVRELLQGKRSVFPLPEGSIGGNVTGFLCQERQGQAKKKPA